MKLPKIFLDSGNPEETRRAKGLLGFLDGQTTNPSLVAKNPEVQKYLSEGKKLTEQELLSMYKDIIIAINKEIAGPISVEVYADWNTKASDMLKQAEDMATWGTNIYVKLPTIPEGIVAAHEFVKQGGKVNMTLVFDQTQAASVYAATAGIEAGNRTAEARVFLSPFIGRWDDRGYDGLDLVRNVLKMYKTFDKRNNRKECHVKVLAASIRHLTHFYASIFLGADIVTVPYSLIAEWVHEEKWTPDSKYRYDTRGLKSIRYEDMVQKKYVDYHIEKVEGSLLDEGLKKFATDWNTLFEK